jgi:hypothetical protein
MPHYLAKGLLAQLLDGKLFHHQGISAAQSAAGTKHFLREFPLACFQVRKPFPVCHFRHNHSSFNAMVCPRSSSCREGRVVRKSSP